MAFPFGERVSAFFRGGSEAWSKASAKAADGVTVTSANPIGVSSSEGASMARRMSGFVPSRLHINSILAMEAPLLRARTRQLIANVPHGANASETFTAYAVGDGITPAPLLPEEQAAAVKEAWYDWTDEADADGLTDFYGLETLAARACFDAGECFARRRDRFASDGLTVPVQYQLLEAEQLDQAYTTKLSNGNQVRQGIEFGPIGNRLAYWFWRTHPGDTTLQVSGDRVRVPADQVLHLFKPLRPGQIRGRPWITPGIIKMYDLDQYEDAELMRKKFAAFLMAFIEQEPGADISDTGLVDEDTREVATDDRGTAEVDMEPGLAQLLPKGHKVNIHEPADVGPNFEAFMFRSLLALCAAMGLPYHAVTGDVSKANYSSLRASLLEVKRRISKFQHEVMVFQFCNPIYKYWLPTAVLSGAVAIPNFTEANRKKLSRVKWIAPRWDWVDPLKDMQAEILAVDNGFKSRSDVIEGMGDDPAETDKRIAADQEREDRLKLRLNRKAGGGSSLPAGDGSGDGGSPADGSGDNSGDNSTDGEQQPTEPPPQQQQRRRANATA
jgi:lambda family phage portal protein